MSTQVYMQNIHRFMRTAVTPANLRQRLTITNWTAPRRRIHNTIAAQRRRIVLSRRPVHQRWVSLQHLSIARRLKWRILTVSRYIRKVLLKIQQSCYLDFSFFNEWSTTIYYLLLKIFGPCFYLYSEEYFLLSKIPMKWRELNLSFTWQMIISTLSDLVPRAE